MSDVFISYARPAEAEARRIVEALRGQGYSVWRDDELPPHRAYAEVIEERLRASKAVIVLWTADAARSQWVRAEADLARGAGKLVQIALDGTTPPLPFNQIQCANLNGWAGQTDAAEWRKIADSIAELCAAAASDSAQSAAVNRPAPRPAAGLGHSGSVGRRAPRRSIVVLPFANRSGDPEQDYFVDGVTESLTTDLSRIHGSFVIARNTAFAFKGRDAKEVGEKLGVRYVLEGSVQRGGVRLRVNVQLIDAANGATLWADRFDKEISDIFEMQDEIVTRLARALDVQMVAAEARRAERTVDPDNVDALAALAQYDGLAIALAFTPDGGWASYDQAEKWAIRAVELVPGHALAHLALAQVHAFTDRVDQSLSEYERALQLDRNLAHAYAGFAASKLYGGRAEEAEADILRAFHLSPQDARAHLWCLIAGSAKLFHDEDAAAETWFRRGIEINRSYPIQVMYLAAALVGLGRLDEAEAMAREALTAAPRLSISLVRAIRRSTNPTYVKQLACVIEKLRVAGIPD
ncbi:MAG TPA: TIR domain-containing protein [Caulobacteraceae bacterium]|nr:TIR domain-containing protein [Caulobacteraceae bacterium]